MRIYVFVPTVWLLIAFVDAKKRTNSERIQHLMAATKRGSVLKFDDETFNEFIGKASIPRNYSVVLMMTLPFDRCAACLKFYEEYKLIADSWKASPFFSSKLFFGCVYSQDSSHLFEKYSIKYVPVFLYFADDGNLKTPQRTQLFESSAESLGRWISAKSDVRIKIVRPIDYSTVWSLRKYIIPSLLLVFARKYIIRLMYSRTFWAVTAIFVVCLMTSGQMWNNITQAAFIYEDAYFSDNGQSVIETYIIVMIYGGITFAMVLMGDALKASRYVPKRKVKAFIGLLLTAIFVSLLLYVYRIKDRDYPYSFLF